MQLQLELFIKGLTDKSKSLDNFRVREQAIVRQSANSIQRENKETIRFDTRITITETKA